MAINPSAVKLFESQRLTDESDGGGRATGNEITDGNINNIFPDISRLDRTVGDVALRKAFLGIDTDNQDMYLGAHAIITEPPADPNVHVLMFDAGSESDERADAQDRIENYVVQGARAQFELLGNQYENQRQIVAIQREEQTLPATGDVYTLKDGEDTQYVRISDVDHEMQTFTYLSGSSYLDFRRRRIVLGISAPLGRNYPGGEATPAGTTSQNSLFQNKSEVFSTEVADAARYWGVTRSRAEAEIGDLTIDVDSIYASLVPSAQSEQPLADQPLGYNRRTVRAASSADHTMSLTALWISTTVLRVFLPRSCTPGTLQLSLAGNTYADNGTGILTRSTGSFPLSTLTIDYETGTIEGTRDSGTDSGTESGSATFRPGGPFTGRATSDSIDVDLSNRSYNYVRTYAAEKPRPGTLQISYMVLGKWYEIRDPGNGVLEGDGSGSVNFVTGTITVSLLQQADVGSAIIFSFLMDIEEEIEAHNGTLASAIPQIELQLLPGINPGSAEFTYTAGGVTKTITDSGDGTLTGDGSGEINYGLGSATLTLSVLHDDGTTIDATYDAVAPASVSDTQLPSGGGLITGTIPDAPLLPGSITFTATLQAENGAGTVFSYPRKIPDDGAGGFLGFGGTVNYTTGDYSLEIAPQYSRFYQRVVGGPIEKTFRYMLLGNAFVIKYQTSDAVHGAESSSHAPGQLTMTLIDSGDDLIMPSSLLFTFAGETYIDRDGILYKGFDSQTGAATAVGTINYNDRTVTLDTWLGGSSPGIVMIAGLTFAATTVVSRVVFRTPGAPLRPESLQISVTDIDGNAISVLADENGDLTHASLSGTVNYQTGVVHLWFTTDDGDDTGESDVYVIPSAGLYNAVLFSYLPLDADLIGLDPVRLPSDGRVPIFRTGGVVVISHTAATDAGTPTDGEVVVLARDHQASIIVEDANGLAMDPAQYTANKITGTVTFANPVTLESVDEDALVTPLSIKDRVEHMTVINDIQISGSLTFIAPLAHDFPAEETVVSSALLWGDINSRYTNFFTQKTWSSGSPNWTDERIGDDTSANYNDIDNPIEIANRGAITERWALVFTSSTAYNVVGENLGVIGTGTVSVDLAPNNPNKDFPYFVVRAAGWGGGWANGNVVRFDTDGCLAPIWIARTVLSGASTVNDDKVVMQFRGDAD